MKKKLLFLIVGLMSVMIMAGPASAFVSVYDLPISPLELDMDDWTRLYDKDENIVPVGADPVVGYESRSFISYSDISTTYGYGGVDIDLIWVGGHNGEYLHGVERNIEISEFYTQSDGGVNIYFDHVTMDESDSRYWEFELYETDITNSDFKTGPAFLGAGPGSWDTIYSNLSTDPESTLIIQGRFAQSTYSDPIGGVVEAVVGIELPLGLLGGEWLEQVTMPFGLLPDAFLDVNPNVGIGNQFIQALYGYGPDGSQYDVAIGNVGLDAAADGNGWITSDDWTRVGTVPEPATMLLLGSGLVGLAGIARKKRNKK